MNNLYRDLAPVTEAAWKEIELEATRTFKRHIAGRRVVDVSEPGGPVAAAVSTGRLANVASPTEGVEAHLRESKPLVRLRVPFTLSRYEIDNVERGANDSDWDPVKAAAKKLAFVEDRAIFEGYAAASIEGIRSASSNKTLTLPADPSEIPDVITQAISELRLAGVDGPYWCCCPPTSTRRSARRPNMDIRSSNTSTGWFPETSSGPRPSTAPSC